MAEHLMQVVDLMGTWAVHDGKLTYTRGNKDPEEEHFVKLGMEVPAYMRLVRILKAQPEPTRSPVDVPGHVSVGATIELDFYTLGVKVFVRYGRDGTLRIITEDGDGREVLAKYERNTDT